MAQTQPKLLYFGDPMCSWCYGFSPEFSQVIEAVEGKVEVQLVMGGLRPYGTETMTDLGDFLHDHWEEVGQRSGQQFNYGILQNMDFKYDTEPACRAVVTMRELKPEMEFAFFKAVQNAFYYENKNTNISATYGDLAAHFGVDEKIFIEKYESKEMKELVRQDFAFSQELGVRGFPTVVLQKGEQYFLLSNGYEEAGNIIEKINQIISN